MTSSSQKQTAERSRMADFGTAEYRAIFEASPDGCLIVDAAGVIQGANARAEELFGYTRPEMAGMNVEQLVPESLRAPHRHRRKEYQQEPRTRPMGIGLELRGRRRDGRELPVEIGLSPLQTEAGDFVVVTVHDVSDRARLRAFGSGILRGAEEERQRLARELHDDTAQSLSALLLRLQMARRTDDRAKREALLAEMHGEILRASESVHRILQGLRPPALDEVGVVAAIRGHARTTLADAGLEVEIDAEPVEQLLSSEGRLALYRIVQEALSNVARHAAAQHVLIRVAVADGGVEATVRDDGRGFSVAEAVSAHGRGLGVLGMQERANILGGRVEIASDAGEGTAVRIWIPAAD